MRGESKIRMILRSLHHYLLFFTIAAFLKTCGLSLFGTTLQHTMGITFTEEQIRAAEKMSEGDFSMRVPPAKHMLGEEVFNQIGDCFNKMAEELSSVETLRTDFISNVSHELKTTLAAIQNYGTMLQQPGLSEEKRMEYSKSIMVTCRRLATLIINILKLNKLENQQILPQTEEYMLDEQIIECLLQYENIVESSVGMGSTFMVKIRRAADGEM